MPRRTPTGRDVITLADLAPRHRVTGGSERRVFGADPIGSEMAKVAKKGSPSVKDLPAKKPVKGGKKRT